MGGQAKKLHFYARKTMKNKRGVFSSTARYIQPRTIDFAVDCSLMQLYILNSWITPSAGGLFSNCKFMGVRLKVEVPASPQLGPVTKHLWPALLHAPRDARPYRRRRYRGGFKGARQYRAWMMARLRGLHGQFSSDDWRASYLKSIYVGGVPARLAGLVHSKTLLFESAWSLINLRFWRASNQNFIRSVRWTSEFLAFSSVNFPLIMREESTPLYPFFITSTFLRLPWGQLLRAFVKGYAFLMFNDRISDPFIEKSYTFFVPRKPAGKIELHAADNLGGVNTNLHLDRAARDLRELELEYDDEFSDFINDKPASISLEGDVGFRLAPPLNHGRFAPQTGFLKTLYRYFWLAGQTAPISAAPRNIKRVLLANTRLTLASLLFKSLTPARFDGTEYQVRNVTQLHAYYNYNNVVRPWVLAYWIAKEWCLRTARFSVLVQLTESFRVLTSTVLSFLDCFFLFKSYLITIKSKAWLFLFNFHKIFLLFFYYFRLLNLWWSFFCLHVQLRNSLVAWRASLYSNEFTWWAYLFGFALGFYYVLGGALTSLINIFFLWLVVETIVYLISAQGVKTFSFFKMGKPLELLWSTLRGLTFARLSLDAYNFCYVRFFTLGFFSKTTMCRLRKSFVSLQHPLCTFFSCILYLVGLPNFLQEIVRGVTLYRLSIPRFSEVFITKGARLYFKNVVGVKRASLNFLRTVHSVNALWLFFYVIYLNCGSFGWWINSMKGDLAPLYLNAVYLTKLLQSTPSIGYYTAISLVRAQVLRLFIYLFELGATRGFTSRSFFSIWIFSKQRLAAFSSNLELIRHYANDMLIEGYLHKAFSPQALGFFPAFLGGPQKTTASCNGSSAEISSSVWWFSVCTLLQTAWLLIFLLFVVFYRLCRIVWVYFIARLFQIIFLVTLTGGAVAGVLLQVYWWVWLIKVVVLCFFIICVRWLQKRRCLSTYTT